MKNRVDHHNPQYGGKPGNFNFSYHWEMVNDYERVGQIKRAFAEGLVKDGVHCEFGPGTGIFLLEAAKTCRKVYGVELDENVYQVAKANIERSPYADKIELIHADASTIELPEKVDTLFAELMSVWCIEEPQALVMDNGRKLIKEGGRLMPSKVINLVDFGNVDYEYGGIQMKCSMPQFTGIKAPRIMSTSYVFNELDFYKPKVDVVDAEIAVESLISGLINCARLHSLIQYTPNVSYYTTDSLMPVTIVPLAEPIKVNVGDKLIFRASYEHRSSLDGCTFEVRKI